MQKIVGARKSNDKNIYYFPGENNYNVGDEIVVEMGEFQTIAKIERVDVELKENYNFDDFKIVRKATESDLKKYNSQRAKAKEQLPAIKKKSLDLGLVMKFVDAEYSLDNSKVMITFSSEERVDFRQFLKDLAVMLKTRIELKQIGQRDEVKVLGGVGPCGEPCCCARFLKDFEHVTVKMAKNQGLSLAPTKINGVCGRLMCCLGYESDMYEEILTRMPKINSEVICPKGKGIVVYNDILRERVSVKREADGENFIVEDYDLSEISGFKSKQNDSKQSGQAENKAQPQQKGNNQNNNKKEKHFGNNKKDKNDKN